jgi:phospholipid/cholesterol/gamma-HCH transport system substrate-binding protein
MKPIVRDFLVGTTVLAGLVVLILGLMFFGELTFERRYEFKVQLVNAAGLSKASRVTMNGVSIGEVKLSKIRPADVGGVELTVLVNESISIPRKAVVGIEKGLIGDASLDFSIPQGLNKTDIADCIKPGEEFNGGNPTSMFDRITQSLEKPLSRLTQTAERIEQLADVYTRVGEKVNEALEPRSLADVESGKAPNLRSLMARIDLTLKGADAVLGDDELRNHLKSVIARADATMGDAQSLVGDLRKTASKVDGFVDAADKTVKTVEDAAGTAKEKLTALSDAAVSTLHKAEEAAGKVAAMLDQASAGHGTLGQLVNNPDLYNSLRDATTRLDKALAEFQLLAEKFRTEGVKLRL